ncbi:Maph89 [Matsumuraeses phaseoli granulovirus]|uniref:Maph89 n=1 Tax=Matsumuraeses phaseoli granulovirus TaxID=2760664 RepID=A0AAE7MLL7_9BBAC|nr:Maph89 [Matsumuraeses phaseoli granulovirus]QOD40052.1 Maph89 [Matsumuraeses phaseoli granulovirus]
MKRGLYYFLDVYPIVLLDFGNDNYYFKLKQLVACFRSTFNKTLRCLHPRYVIKFKILKEAYPGYNEHTLHPNTLLVHINGFKNLTQTLCKKPMRQMFYEFVCQCLKKDNKIVDKNYQVHNVEDGNINMPEEQLYECVNCDYGTVNNIEFIGFENKFYFKAVDVARYIQCSSSYTINKYVDDKNMVLWRDLKNYFNNMCVWSNYTNRWKNHTIFLKELGLQQLIMAVKKDDKLYRDIIIDVNTFDDKKFEPYIKQLSKYKKKHLKANGCVLGKMLDDTVEFIMLPNKIIYFKLRQIVKHYSLRIANYNYYCNHLKDWSQLKRNLTKCNINWKKNLVMVDAEGVYKMLKDVGLQTEAEEFFFNKIYNATTSAFNHSEKA